LVFKVFIVQCNPSAFKHTNTVPTTVCDWHWKKDESRECQCYRTMSALYSLIIWWRKESHIIPSAVLGFVQLLNITWKLTVLFKKQNTLTVIMALACWKSTI